MQNKGKIFIKLFLVIILVGIIGVIYKCVYGTGNNEKDAYVDKTVAANKDTNEVDESEEKNQATEEQQKEEVEQQAEQTETQEERIETIEIRAIGDLLMHIDLVQAMYDYNTGTYNFDYNFELMNGYLSNADLTIANLETTLAGEESGYEGYPCFNTPDELADSMKNAGIDVVSNMSNHSLDKGEYGFLRTRRVLKEKGFDVIGTRDNDKESRYIIKDIKGIKVGITAYGYTTEDSEGGRGLNGIPIPESVNPLMNTFNPDDVDKDLLAMKQEIEKMRKENVDAIIFYMHWGEEYQLEPNESQLKIAKFLANEGVDIIFGDHPHTIQPIDIVQSDDGKHSTAVVYSLGNFISSQRTETIGNPYTEDGLLVSVNITKNFKTGEVKVDPPKYIPTWVKLNVAGGNYYQVVPATNDSGEYLDYYQSSRVDESFSRTSGIVESYNGSIQVWNGN